MNKTVQVILLCAFLLFTGFCAGMFLGTVVVPAGSGLAGPPMALGYGVAGMAAGLVTGILIARNLSNRGLRNALIITGLLSVILVAWIIHRVKQTSRPQVSVIQGGRLHWGFHPGPVKRRANQNAGTYLRPIFSLTS